MTLRFRRLEVVLDSVQRIQQPAYHVITNSTRLTRIYGNMVTKPPVSLKNYVLVSVHRGVCRSGGYSVLIKAIEIHRRDMVVAVCFVEPTKAQPVTLVATYPLDMVAVPRRGLGAVGSYRALFMRGETELAVVPFVV